MISEAPVYLDTHRSGLLRCKVEQAESALSSCELCPKQCRADRLAGELGACRTGRFARLNCYKAHVGEETPLLGQNGSGTFFFACCNLQCIFCQNHELSHGGEGREVSANELADMMMILQDSGCSNIHFITPTHVVPQILAAVDMAIPRGLSVPLVYNSSGYESVDTLKLLAGVVDIYMPDFKFWDPDVSEKLCGARDYPEIARQAISEMHHQVGDLVMDDSGRARRGLLLRHLILPSGLAGTRDIMRFVAREISRNTYVNIMPQFKPYWRSKQVRELLKPVTEADYACALRAAREEGITRIDPKPGKVFMGF